MRRAKTAVSLLAAVNVPLCRGVREASLSLPPDLPSLQLKCVRRLSHSDKSPRCDARGLGPTTSGRNVAQDSQKDVITYAPIHSSSFFIFPTVLRFQGGGGSAGPREAKVSVFP